MKPLVAGIHHVTAFAGDAARNRRFYEETLGFPLVKRTVNFDSPSMWHLYYGHAHGAPGTLLTHFPEPRAARARHGGSEIADTTIALGAPALAALPERLERAGLPHRFATVLDRETLVFEDPDGLRLAAELATDRQQPSAAAEIARVTLAVPDADATRGFLTRVLGFAEAAREDRRTRLVLGAGGSGREVDVVAAPELRPEPQAAGTMHHVAWRVADDDAQAVASRALRDAGVAVTATLDRRYFRSIYFRIPGGILFEIATDTPGFTVDEAPGELGRALRLPPQFESARAQIEAALPALD